ncbi:MAG: CHAT domain-containing protein, partial [Tabrizicola sp.]|nr:CHAT domain-containing protein [Tabrizicola sp.]
MNAEVTSIADEGYREPARTVDLRLIQGNIVNVPSPAYVLGIFDQVNPTGAARAVDEALGGALNTLIEGRMFGGNLGEISILPTPRQRSLTDMVVFAGLGPIGSFKVEFLESVFEKLICVLITAKLTSFATVPISLNVGSDPLDFVKHASRGMLRGLDRMDRDHDFQRIDVVEFETQRYQEISRAIYSLHKSGYFDPIRIVIREAKVASDTPGAIAGVARTWEPDPVYLTVSRSKDSEYQGHRLHYDFLNNRPRATIAKREKQFADSDIERLNAIIAELSRCAAISDSAGDQLSALMLDDGIRSDLGDCFADGEDGYLIIRHDRETSRVPWEIARVNDCMLALERGISRLYLADKQPMIVSQRKKNEARKIKVLLIGDPTGDLRGARNEIEVLERVLSLNNALAVEALFGAQATREAIFEKLKSGDFDIVHYAGHAFFDKDAPGQSGLVCAGREILRGEDVYGSAGLPWLIFCNACESGMMASDLRACRRGHGAASLIFCGCGSCGR